MGMKMLDISWDIRFRKCALGSPIQTPYEDDIQRP